MLLACYPSEVVFYSLLILFAGLGFHCLKIMVLSRINHMNMENTLLSLSIVYVIMWSMWLIITAVMRYLKSNTSTGSDQSAVLQSNTSSSRCSSSFGLNARRRPVVMQNYQTFKTFDIIDDFKDHHYRNTLGFRGYQVRWLYMNMYRIITSCCSWSTG